MISYMLYLLCAYVGGCMNLCALGALGSQKRIQTPGDGVVSHTLAVATHFWLQDKLTISYSLGSENHALR